MSRPDLESMTRDELIEYTHMLQHELGLRDAFHIEVSGVEITPTHRKLLGMLLAAGPGRSAKAQKGD